MNLINSNTHTKIRNVLRDVTDTFCTTPVRYYRALDEFADGQMMSIKEKPFTEFNLFALVEYPETETTEIDEMVSGAVDKSEVKLTLNFDDCKEAGFITGNLPEAVVEEDFFTVNREDYKATFVKVEGAFEPENVLVIITGRKIVKSR